MPIAAPLLVPFAELVGITTAGLALSQVSDAVQSYMKANPEQSMKILMMLSPELGIASMMKKKTTKPKVEVEVEDEEEKLTAKEKNERFKELAKTPGRGRQDFIDLAKKLGLAKKGSEEQPPEDDEEEQILTGAQKTQLFKNLFKEGGERMDFARLGRATKRGNQGLYQEGLEALKKTLKGKKDGGRIGYAIGGLTDRAQGIYNSMLAANFDDQTIIDTLNQLGIYNQDTPVVTTPEVVNTQPNIIGQQVNYGGNDMPLSTGSTTDLTSNFKTSTQERQNRLTNPNKVQSFVNKFTGGGQPDIGEMIRTGQVDTRASAGIPLGVGALIGRALPDKYYDMSLGDQVFTQSQMGYTGPTVFGENTVGNYKDPFGLNVRSAFGNYSEAVGESFNTLRDALTGRLSDKYGAEFDEELGMFTGTNADLANQMTKMMRNKFKFRTEQLAAKNRLDAQIKAAEEKRKAEAAKKIIEEEAAKKAQYGATNYGIGSDGQQSYSGDAIGAPGLGFGIGATTGGPVSNRTGRGRTGYQAGGVATPEQYAKALQQVGAGSALDKLRSTGDYIKNYVSNVGQSVLNKNPAIRGIASFYGVGKPISSFSDFSSGSQQAIKDAVMRTVQNPTLNQYSKTNIPMSSYTNYFSDKGKANTRGIYDTGYISRSDQFKDMISALGGNEDAIARMTLGRFNVDIDPTSGVGYLRDKYDFSKQMPGGKAYDINMQLPQDFVQQILNNPTYQKTTGYTPPTTQTTSSIPQFYQNNPGSYDFDKFKEAYAFATGQQNLVSRTPDGQIVTNFGNWDPSNTYGAYMADRGTSNSNPFFSQFSDPNTFNKNTLISMYGAPGAGKAYYADGGLATMFSEKK